MAWSKTLDKRAWRGIIRHIDRIAFIENLSLEDVMLANINKLESRLLLYAERLKDQ
jgi:hypothetical protein